MPSAASTASGDQSLEELRRELAEAREQQAATAEILHAISSSPRDLQRVFSEIAVSAARLCDAYDAAIHKVDGDFLPVVAHHGPIPIPSTLPLRAGFVAGRAVLDQRTIHVADAQVAIDVYPEGSDVARVLGFRTILAVPLIRTGKAIGVISIRRRDVRAFTDRQIDLLKTFADQAVIAIENTRLFEAEQARTREVTERTRELTEALEQQTATADVLKVISRSALDVQKVLDALVESAARLCNAHDVGILQVVGDSLRLVAHHGQIPMSAPVGQLILPLARGTIGGRAVVDRRTIQVADILTEENEYPVSWKRALQTGFRTALAVPLVHAGEAIGVIVIRRAEVRPFTERQIELVNTFADQAVIAIENTRLFEAEQASKRELQESLEFQTAISEVLAVISRSPSDLRPVLEAIVETAARLCQADKANIRRKEGAGYSSVASIGLTQAQRHFIEQTAVQLDRSTIGGRVALDRETVHIPDVLEDRNLRMDIVSGIDFRTGLGVPLLRKGELIGLLLLSRDKRQPFSRRQIELVETFADQAVIAIENARLFEEVQARTRELAKTVEDLEVASQHKNQFVANMSHELRTPLAAILGYAELIQEGFYGALPEKSMDALTRIRSNGKHLLGLINTVLDIAKIEAGQFTLNMTEYAIESVVETVRAATESLAQNKKLALTTSVDKSLPVGLGDEQRLTQVLLNLVGNAIKFTDAGEVSIAAGARNGHFAVSVTDTGPGIPLDQQGRIFEQFHQVDSSLTKAKGGTGLGLAIAKQIVEMHGGRIWVESMPGKGSNFQLELPIRAEIRRGNAFS